MWYIIGTEAVIAVKEFFQQPATDVNPIHHWRDFAYFYPVGASKKETKNGDVLSPWFQLPFFVKIQDPFHLPGAMFHTAPSWAQAAWANGRCFIAVWLWAKIWYP